MHARLRLVEAEVKKRCAASAGSEEWHPRISTYVAFVVAEI